MSQYCKNCKELADQIEDLKANLASEQELCRRTQEDLETRLIERNRLGLRLKQEESKCEQLKRLLLELKNSLPSNRDWLDPVLEKVIKKETETL